MGVKVRKPDGYSAWCVVIDHKGQRKTIAVGSREAAERVRREVEVRLALGGTELLENRKPVLPTLTEYSKEWLAHVGHERKPSTAGFYGEEHLGEKRQFQNFTGCSCFAGGDLNLAL